MARLKVAKKYAVYGNITILSSIFHARAGALLLPGSNPISPSVYKAKIRETLAHKFCWFRKPSRGQGKQSPRLANVWRLEVWVSDDWGPKS
jgi:hypothetical protein